MKKLHLLLPIALLALTLTACGGGGSTDASGGGDEDEIVSTVEVAATSDDPSACQETQTLRFMEQTTGSSGDEAEKQCEEEAKEGENADSASVTEVEVDGGKATANVAFDGGDLDGQTAEIALLEEDGSWKLDEFAGFAEFDPTPLIDGLKEKLEEEPEIDPQLASCIVEGLEDAPADDLEKLVTEQDTGPIQEVAEACQ